MQSVTDETFAQEVEEASRDQVVIVNFSAAWCGPCKNMKPLVEQLAAETPDAKFVFVDVDDAPQMTEKFGIRGVPTYMSFRDGEQKDTIAGAGPGVIDAIKGFVNGLSGEPA
ncbi:MAG: thioredoxin family protein [Armatimonadetes bacterium]|nr:thioredoxin family protein [Armatimonadota bacterium]